MISKTYKNIVVNGFFFFGVVFFSWDEVRLIPSCATKVDFWVCVWLTGEKKTPGILERRRRRDHPQDQDYDDGGGGGGDDVGVVARESITREEDSIENSEPKGDENHWRRKKI